MDFLDPKAKRRSNIRLYIGYALMGVLILIASLILVFQAYGFDVDRKTGEVIQNGLVFVDSAPDGAEVSFNNQLQKDKTNNRFALPSGQYNLHIHKEGYRDWNRNFALDGGEVERYTYPLLIPKTLDKTELQQFEVAPRFASSSPDRRWLIASQPGGSLQNFVEYDLNSVTESKIRPESKNIVVPSNIFTPADGEHSIELVEWANDNKHFLIRHNFSGKYEFIIISRDAPETSFNINALLGLNPATLVLKDKKFDQWYLQPVEGGVLQTADTKKTLTNIVNNVVTFKAHGDDALLYAQPNPVSKNIHIMLQQGKENYLVKEIPAGPVFLDIARYDDAWYAVVGTEAEHKVYIYKDPVNTLQKKDGTKPAPQTILRAIAPITNVSFSNNTRFIVAQSGQHFEVFDAEHAQNYKYDISDVFDPATKVIWMDGHRLLSRSQNKIIIFDFDGSNKQELVSSLPNMPLIFDRDYTVLYSIDVIPNQATKSTLYSSQLRLKGDR